MLFKQTLSLLFVASMVVAPAVHLVRRDMYAIDEEVKSDPYWWSDFVAMSAENGQVAGECDHHDKLVEKFRAHRIAYELADVGDNLKAAIDRANKVSSTKGYAKVVSSSEESRHATKNEQAHKPSVLRPIETFPLPSQLSMANSDPDYCYAKDNFDISLWNVINQEYSELKGKLPDSGKARELEGKARAWFQPLFKAVATLHRNGMALSGIIPDGVKVGFDNRLYLDNFFDACWIVPDSVIREYKLEKCKQPANALAKDVHSLALLVRSVVCPSETKEAGFDSLLEHFPESCKAMSTEAKELYDLLAGNGSDAQKVGEALKLGFWNKQA